LVLRNAKLEPPVVKIMSYKMELLKKLFAKLGRTGHQEKEEKSKTLRLTTTISVHDLENKKRQALTFLKDSSSLKFYMKVNIYDDDNIQKGRLMLMNIAEDLKEYAKVKVSPMQEGKPAAAKEEEKDQGKKGAKGKKPTKIEDISKEAKASKSKQEDLVVYDEHDEDGDDDIESRA
jgi:hypothetical protein